MYLQSSTMLNRPKYAFRAG